MNFLMQLLAGLLISTTTASSPEKEKNICSRRVCMICAYVLENNVATEEHRNICDYILNETDCCFASSAAKFF
ncbi:Oidioi.mRNA.OKI2018_I69.chr2.g5773.t1.cds [Oikopleura dioica]|uniref:Oidioi.mRNA.OKI2018_I69.chr2.g5773.t1.cds n=1 Tax=Oikopleura dioica TaxID=34765 RepID=A0ABN7T705_OIKDI|nr:Oidioi.mRNA.OKI2018_I69.chr2.g5773.t1.cds [Oikopleura dioica]